MKRIDAKLREEITCSVVLGNQLDFTDLLTSSAVVEETKRKLLYEIKQKMHEKVAMLGIEDLRFEVKE